MGCVKYIITLTTSQLTELFLKRRHIYDKEKVKIEKLKAEGDFSVGSHT